MQPAPAQPQYIEGHFLSVSISAHISLKLLTVNWGTLNSMMQKFDHDKTNSHRVIKKAGLTLIYPSTYMIWFELLIYRPDEQLRRSNDHKLSLTNIHNYLFHWLPSIKSSQYINMFFNRPWTSGDSIHIDHTTNICFGDPSNSLRILKTYLKKVQQRIFTQSNNLSSEAIQGYP